MAVRQVEYTPFPRVPTGRQRRMGFTRNLSGSGLCFRAEEAQPVGSLLRVVVRSVDGRPALESVARIAWCEPSAEGAWLGLSLVESRSARGWQGMEAGRS